MPTSSPGPPGGRNTPSVPPDTNGSTLPRFDVLGTILHRLRSSRSLSCAREFLQEGLDLRFPVVHHRGRTTTAPAPVLVIAGVTQPSNRRLQDVSNPGNGEGSNSAAVCVAVSHRRILMRLGRLPRVSKGTRGPRRWRCFRSLMDACREDRATMRPQTLSPDSISATARTRSRTSSARPSSTAPSTA